MQSVKDVRICRKDCKNKNGNCLILGTDKLPLQCVGIWVEDKYYFLEKYLNASCEARRKFSDKGNAVFIDLFAGPGKCIVRNQRREILNGGLRALAREEAPFNEYYYFDINEVNVDALRQRTSGNSNCYIKCGDSNMLVKELIKDLLNKHYRYHFAFIDPFSPDALNFETITELAKLKRMDMLIHFPIGAIKRNLNHWIKKEDSILDNFLGTKLWRDEIVKWGQNRVYQALINVFTTQLKKIGYPEDGLRLAASKASIHPSLPTVPVRNTRNVRLYVLVLVSKHKLAQAIWNSIIRIGPDGQRTLF